MASELHIHAPEVWDAEKCRKLARRVAKDGMGVKHPFKGFIGNHYGEVRYNGGCDRNGEWYAGEVFPLPFVAPGFRLFQRATWGWYIEEIPAVS